MKPILERIKDIKEIWRLCDDGMSMRDAAELIGIAYYSAVHMLQSKKRALYAYNFYQVENLKGKKLEDAINRYLNAEPMKDIIEGVKLAGIGGEYFIALHVAPNYEIVEGQKPEYQKIRMCARNKKEYGDNEALKLAKITQAKLDAAIRAAKKAPTSDFEMFEDEESENVHQPAGVLIPSKARAGFYGCAAAMCADA
jgi:hypothetical protein